MVLPQAQCPEWSKIANSPFSKHMEAVRNRAMTRCGPKAWVHEGKVTPAANCHASEKAAKRQPLDNLGDGCLTIPVVSEHPFVACSIVGQIDALLS
jgi:hypothetical protein